MTVAMIEHVGLAPLGLAALLALGIRPQWRATVGWLALALCGAQSSLNLIQAGPTVSYHHYRPHGDPALMWSSLAVLAIELVAVAIGVARRSDVVVGSLRRALPGWRAVAVLASIAACSAKISRPASASALEFAFATTVHLTSIGAVALAALSLPPSFLSRLDAWWARAIGPWDDAPRPTARIDRWIVALALASGAVSAAFAFLVYDAHPHVPDEVVYLLQARYLAAGELSMPAPAVPEAFDVDLMMLEGGRWYSPVNPGWPFALALGELLGIPWLVNPLLGVAGVLLTYLLVREIASLAVARVAAGLLALSPWFVFMNMSLMTHSWTLACALVAALGVARARRTQRGAWGWLAGVFVGIVAWIRPLEGLVLAALLGLWMLGAARPSDARARMRSFGALAGLVIATGVTAALVLPYNAHFTGSPQVFPINRYVDTVYGAGKNDLGFGPDKGLGWGLDAFPGHSPLEAALNAQINAFAIDAELLGWCTGSILLLALLLAARRLERIDRLMLVFGAAIVVSNSLYWFHGGPDFGARYWYLVIVPCVVLAARGWRSFEARVERPARVQAFVLALIAIAWLSFVPWRAIDKYPNYRGMRAEVGELARRHGFGRSLVLVRGARHPDFASAVVANPLDLEADAPIFAWDRDAGTRKRLLEHYADRPVWIVEGPTVTGSSYRVAAGPLRADELAR